MLFFDFTGTGVVVVFFFFQILSGSILIGSFSRRKLHIQMILDVLAFVFLFRVSILVARERRM